MMARTVLHLNDYRNPQRPSCPSYPWTSSGYPSSSTTRLLSQWEHHVLTTQMLTWTSTTNRRSLLTAVQMLRVGVGPLMQCQQLPMWLWLPLDRQACLLKWLVLPPMQMPARLMVKQARLEQQSVWPPSQLPTRQHCLR
jgi:hypothetical protein